MVESQAVAKISAKGWTKKGRHPFPWVIENNARRQKTAPKDRKRLSEELGKLLSEAGTVDFMRAALEGALNMLMQLEAEASAGAARCGRSEARTARLNAARSRQLDTAAGSVQRPSPSCAREAAAPRFWSPGEMSARRCCLPYRRTASTA
jgi:hypothetical protein